jgi:hypothetical protein
MKILRFEGHSDDTFGEILAFRDTADNCASGKPIVWEVTSESRNEGLRVWGEYAGRDWPREGPACWMIGVQPLDEDVPIPPWAMGFEPGKCGYSPALIIHAPDDVTIDDVSKAGEP